MPKSGRSFLIRSVFTELTRQDDNNVIYAVLLKKERTYYFILGGLILTFLVVELLKPTPLNWTESFSAEDKIPYGGYLIHELLPSAFPGEEITTNQIPIFEYADTTHPRKNWIFINTGFQLDEWESEKLLSQVEQGAHLFIAARTYGGLFADTLNLSTTYENPFLGGSSILDDDTSFVNFTHPELKKEGGYPYFKSTTQTHFSTTDTSRTTLLGVNEDDQPIFIKLKWGQGNIYLHSNPTLFTNYFVRDEPGAEYALTALSYLPVQPTLWDEYYKEIRRSRGSAVRYIVSQEHLKWAWFLSLAGLVLFMIFRARRKQRIIPNIEPPKNTSIEFARTIGNLYMEKGDHKLIADKKIRFFFDYIRSHLGLDTHELNEEFRKDVALRSGLGKDEIGQLIEMVNNISGKENITQNELKQLTEEIDYFYKTSQR